MSAADGARPGAEKAAPRRDDDGRGAGYSIVQRVRFGDLDAMQHMNNVEFLRFFETARIDYILQLSPEHAPTERRQFGFIFAECHIAYKAPAFFGDTIRTYIWPSELKRSSLKLARASFHSCIFVKRRALRRELSSSRSRLDDLETMNAGTAHSSRL